MNGIAKAARSVSVAQSQGSRRPSAPPVDSRPGCIQRPDVFQHELLEEPPVRSASAATHETYNRLRREAKTVCDACPLQATCLYDAIARHDVSGFVAGTTQAQRRQIRNVLDVEITQDDFDQLAGARSTRRPVSHEEVLRLRNTYPNESLESLALRMGCSLSTVKRHLRRARRGQSPVGKAPKAAPTMLQVTAAYEMVTTSRTLRGGRTRVA